MGVSPGMKFIAEDELWKYCKRNDCECQREYTPETEILSGRLKNGTKVRLSREYSPENYA